ncbi:class I adenylate-forming enzyme family protein [Micromonospora sp. NPDC092111]|uniref:class I adenylate-forming enzyme family protein n=1 Tax=Micromonospora sp. NPDC092111 TaxID=3364289 RepID=UPI00380FF385
MTVGLFAALGDRLGTQVVASARGAVPGARIRDGVERLAAWLGGSGHEPGTLVATCSTVVGTLVAALAADLAGLPVVHVDPLDPAPPAGLRVSDQPGASPAGYADPELAVYASPGGRDGAAPGAAPRTQTFLTSGSTGAPIGVVRGPDAVLADARRVAEFLDYRPRSPIVVAVPLHHAYGFNYGLVAAILAGSGVYHCGPRTIPSQLTRAAERTGGRILIAHPAHYRTVAREAVRTGGPVLGPFVRAVSAGAPLPPGCARDIARRHGPTLYNCYGSSEAGAITLGPVDGTEEPGEVGVPLPGVRVRLGERHGDGGSELLLRTSSLADGYLGPDGLRPLRLDDGWLHTGDLAELDGTRIRLRGRTASVINVAGEKVNPEEVELVLAAHPAVADVDVRAEPDPLRGQVPVAHVVLREDATNADLLAWCRARLAPPKVPRRFEVHADLPRGPTGKRIRHDAAGDPR